MPELPIELWREQWRPAPVPPGRRPRRSRIPSRRRWLIEWALVLVVAALLAVGVRVYVAQMFYIPSGSMLPTLQIGDRIVVDKLSYDFQAVDRGDIVVFRRPPLEPAPYADLVKRVIGLPGDTLSLHAGRVLVDGRVLAEPWLPDPAPESLPSPLSVPFSLNRAYTVPAGEYFVMGDNRTDSEDSRYFGPIPRHLIVGKMAFRAWPLGSAAWVTVGGAVVAGGVVVGLVSLFSRPRRPPPPAP